MTTSEIGAILARLDALSAQMNEAKEHRVQAHRDQLETRDRLARIETRLEAQASLPGTVHDNELSATRVSATAEERERSRDNLRANWGLVISIVAFAFAASAYLRDWIMGQ